MKKYLIMSFILVVRYSSAQEFKDYRSFLKNTDDSISAKEKWIISDRGFNVFFARKTALYLAEEGDLTLFKNYAILSSEEGKFSFGHNFVNNPEKANGRVKWIATPSISTGLKDKYAAVVSDKKFENDLSISVKMTKIGRGFVRHDKVKQFQGEAITKGVENAQKDTMSFERRILMNSLLYDLSQDSLKLINSLNNPTDEGMLKEKKKEAIGKLLKKYKSSYYEKEAEILEERELYNFAFGHWFSVKGDFPVSAKEYYIADSVKGKFSKKDVYLWSGEINYNLFMEGIGGKFFLSTGMGTFSNNSAKAEILDKITYDQIIQMGGTDTIETAIVDSKEEAYIGKYKTFITTQANLDVVWFPFTSEHVGVRVRYEMNFGEYNPSTLKIGIPIKLQGKDKDKVINLELQAKMFDVTNTYKPEDSFTKKLSMGISVGLPFSSMIY